MNTVNTHPIANGTGPFPHAPCAADQRETAVLRDHLSREARSSAALQARVAELEAALDAERKARDADVMRIAESHGEEIESLKRGRDAWKLVAENERELNTLCKHDARAEQEKNLRAAAKDHAREVIWSWMNTDRHVPHDWTAAHPPDDLAAQVMATALGDDGFDLYSKCFAEAWAEQVEAIADEREVRHGTAAGR